MEELFEFQHSKIKYQFFYSFKNIMVGLYNSKFKNCNHIGKQIDPVLYISHSLAKEVVKLILKDGHLRNDRLSVYFRNLVMQMLRRHEILFNSIVIKANNSECGFRCLDSLANTVFSHGTVDWGQIILFYALAGCLALHYKQRNMLNEAQNIPRYMANYINETVTPFVNDHGGWEQIYYEFPVKEDAVVRLRKALIVTGGILGILTVTLSIFSRIHN